jgi:hypothetical protein
MHILSNALILSALKIYRRGSTKQMEILSKKNSHFYLKTVKSFRIAPPHKNKSLMYTYAIKHLLYVYVIIVYRKNKIYQSYLCFYSS